LASKVIFFAQPLHGENTTTAVTYAVNEGRQSKREDELTSSESSPTEETPGAKVLPEGASTLRALLAKERRRDFKNILRRSREVLFEKRKTEKPGPSEF